MSVKFTRVKDPKYIKTGDILIVPPRTFISLSGIRKAGMSVGDTSRALNHTQAVNKYLLAPADTTRWYPITATESYAYDKAVYMMNNSIKFKVEDTNPCYSFKAFYNLRKGVVEAYSQSVIDMFKGTKVGQLYSKRFEDLVSFDEAHMATTQAEVYPNYERIPTTRLYVSSRPAMDIDVDEDKIHDCISDKILGEYTRTNPRGAALRAAGSAAIYLQSKGCYFLRPNKDAAKAVVRKIFAPCFTESINEYEKAAREIEVFRELLRVQLNGFRAKQLAWIRNMARKQRLTDAERKGLADHDIA